MRRGVLAMLGVLVISAAPAWGALLDPLKDAPLPPRQGATTQATAGTITTGGNDTSDFKRVTIAMVIVLGAIFITHKVWKRMGMPGASGKGSGSLQVVSRLSIAPKQQLLLVRVGRRVVLVGNSGSQMNALCDISDAQEAAELLGTSVSERAEPDPASFNSVLDTEEKRFDEQTNVDLAPAPPQEDAAIEGTREELNGLMDRVRSLSRQFGRS